MCINYYKLDTKILMFDLDTPEQRFGIWVAKKEFGQRLKKELPLGQFYMSIRVVAKDLDISDMVVRRIIKLYISEGIISVISISKSPKVASVYAYNTYLENNTVDNTVTTQYEHSNNTVEVSDNAGSEDIDNTVTTQYEHSNNTVDNTSKKKSKRKENIYSDDFEEVWRLFLELVGKGGSKKTGYSKFNETKEIYSLEEIKQSIKYYAEKIIPTLKSETYIKSAPYFFDKDYIQQHIYAAKKQNKKTVVNFEDYID